MRLLTILFLMFCGTMLWAQSSSYHVQLGAFDRAVSLDYFQGISNVQYGLDGFGIHKYYLTGFANEAEAKAAADQAHEKGFHAFVVQKSKAQYLCEVACNAPIDPTTVKPIFFDFDRSSLRAASQRELSKLYQVLIANPGYSVELKAHTDSKGSSDYNFALSERRAQSAKSYLLDKGIPASRIRTSTFGENAPIAKNSLTGGRDTEEGRQYNRRVELEIYDANGKALNAIVEEIKVPTHLKT